MAGRRQHDAFELGAPGDDEIAVRDRHPRRIRRDPILNDPVERAARRFVDGALRLEQQLVDARLLVERDILRVARAKKILRGEYV